MSQLPAVVTILGAGPRGLGILDRLGSALKHQPLNRRVEIHVVDPYEPGSGRVWRPDQPRLMLTNSKAGEITLFSDETVRNAGVPRSGPAVHQWAALHASGLEAELAAEAAAVGPETFVSRRLLGAYLRWCFASAVAALPPTASVIFHRTSGTQIRTTRSADEVVLADGCRIRSDIVVLALGNRDGAPPIAGDDSRNSALRLEPQYTADINLDVLPAGENVQVEGLGLAFIDLMTLVTEGRGGRFEQIQGGRLAYHPSGAEPILNATSPRGVPYLPKPAAARTADPKEPLIATRAAWIGVLTAIASHQDRATRLQAAHAAWGLLHAEMAAGWYGELLGDPLHAADMLRGLSGTPAWDDKRTAAIVAHRELAPFRAPSRQPAGPGNQPINIWARNYLLWALDLVGGQLGHAHAGAYRGLVHAGTAMGEVFLDGLVEFTPAMGPFLGAMASYIRYVTSGPPLVRMEQLLALVEAGFVRLLGPSSHLADDSALGYFVAARLPVLDVRSGPDALLRKLIEAGTALATGPLTSRGPIRIRVEAGSFQLLTADLADGRRRIAVGAFATAGALLAFPRPCANSRFFAENATIASQIIQAIALEPTGATESLPNYPLTVGGGSGVADRVS
ncbi:MAG: FAD/NAD(P)-binding protein [Chloroflexota bacterium]